MNGNRAEFIQRLPAWKPSGTCGPRGRYRRLFCWQQRRIKIGLDREARADRDKAVLCQIVGTGADEKVLGADGKIDAARLQDISFDPCGSTYVKMGEAVGKAFQDGGKLK